MQARVELAGFRIVICWVVVLFSCESSPFDLGAGFRARAFEPGHEPTPVPEKAKLLRYQLRNLSLRNFRQLGLSVRQQKMI